MRLTVKPALRRGGMSALPRHQGARTTLYPSCMHRQQGSCVCMAPPHVTPTYHGTNPSAAGPLTRSVPLQLDTVAEALMLPGVRSLRSVLHSTAIEVLLALTPRHLQSMMDSLIDFLNAQYAKFMARHPTFKVSFWADLLLQSCLRAGLMEGPSCGHQLLGRPTVNASSWQGSRPAISVPCHTVSIFSTTSTPC